MKSILLSAILLFSLQSFSQKSLLWKITHEKSEKSSYLYGTMHISGRLAYHLGEEFYEAIESTDAIALESNPIIWLDEIFASPYASDYLGKYAIQYQVYKGFYQKSFDLTLPDNKMLINDISKDHYLSNWMLYRENKSQIDFQEETFLDLFIYQAGMKSNKSVYSLENFSQTTHFSKMGNMPDPEKKEYDGWFEKLLEDKSAYELIQEAYRNKDVIFLDSLHGQVNSDNYLKWMLDVRNEIMATKIDSFIMKENTSLFIGIGAAHLAGEKGVINYLRNKGYTVEAVTTTITDDTKSLKENYDKKKVDIEFNNEFNSEMFTVKVPGKMFETPPNSDYERSFFSPELTNGSYFSIKQISTYNYFSKNINTDYMSKIDSILFESVPGDIISKKIIKIDGYNGLDIINKTRTGNIQRYHFVLTPLNILIFKMGGKDNFVKDKGDAFFSSIKLKETSSKWDTFTPLKNDFSVKLPDYINVKGNEKITSLYSQLEIEAYESKTRNYYFLKKASLYDYTFIEEDNYELERIADQFCENIDIDSVEITIDDNSKYPTAYGKTYTTDKNYLNLKIIIKGPFYYLLATVSEKEEANPDFFDSFTFKDYKYTFDFETKVDSSLLFTTKSNYLFPTIYSDIYNKAYKVQQENKKKKKEDESFKRKTKTKIYYSENYEQVKVMMYKFHDFAEYDNIDSLWSKEIKSISKKNSLVLKNKQTSQKDDLYILEADFTDTNSFRVLKSKYILKNGVLYRLLTNTDTVSNTSKYVKHFYDHFEPLDTVIGKSIFEDKSKQFFKYIYGNDSLEKEHAFQSIQTHIRFDEEDVDDMMKTITDYPFEAKHINTKKQLIIDLGKIEDDRITPFLVNLYPQVEDTSMYQLAILKALSYQKNKKAYQAFTKLLDYDIPLSSDTWGISNTFSPFYDSLELSSEIFPEVLNFSFVQDYRVPTYRLLSRMLEYNKIKGKAYKKNYKQILREAKIELKSQISYEQNQQAKDDKYSYYYSSYKNKGNELLVNYTNLLIPFYNKPDVQEYFKKLLKIEDFKIKTDIYCILVNKNIEVPSNIWNELASDNINRNYLYKELKWIDRLDLFPSNYKNQNLMVESLLYSKNFNIEKDSLQFISKVNITVKNETGYVYFYKSKKEKDDDWKLDYVGLQPSDTTEVNISSFVFEKGIKIEKHKEIQEIIDEELESIQLEGHYRAKKRSADNGYFGGLFW